MDIPSNVVYYAPAALALSGINPSTRAAASTNDSSLFPHVLTSFVLIQFILFSSLCGCFCTKKYFII